MVTNSLRRGALSLGLLLAFPAVSFGQTTPPLQPPSSSDVDEHLRRGVDFRRAGQDEDAAREFEAAYRAAPEARIAAQLGLARQALGQWLDADRLLREALAAPDDAWVTRNRAALEGALTMVARHVGTLVVRGNVPGAEVLVEGTVVATLPMPEPVRVLAGTLSMDVRAPGHVTVSRRVIIDPGMHARESVELRPVENPAPPTTTPSLPAVTNPVVTPHPVPVAPARPHSALRPWGIASLAGSGVALAVGLVGLIVREDAAVRFNNNCPPQPQPGDDTCEGLQETESSWGTVSVVALPVSAVLAVTGTVLMVLPARTSHRTAWRCLPTGAGIACGATF